MPSADKQEQAKPFKVTTTEGTFVQGFDLQDQAEANAKERNTRANDLGIKARYEVVATATA